jgi:membrane associated rhomboid family serine protease
MEPVSAKIPARSRRQAMDWSLVLLSQGIEHIVGRSEENASWELQVSTQDSEKALNAIQLYQAENRHWPWRRKLFKQELLFDWASISWAVLLCIFYWLEASQPVLRSYGEMDASAVTHGQWWRLFTAVWLHADIAHLAGNAVFGIIFLGLSMARYGTGVGLLAAYTAGAGGNLLAWLVAPQPRFSLGASGMVMGALGLLAVQSFSLWRRDPLARKYILSGILGGVMLFLLLGLSPGSDLLAHAGGFLSGLLLGAILTRLPDLRRRTGAHIVCGFVFTFLSVWPWWLALHSSR